MKKFMLFLFLFLCGTAFAQQNDTSICATNEAAFNGMLNKNGPVTKGPQGKFRIYTDNLDNFVITTEQVKMSVKIWFSDQSGNVYHPGKHRFDPKEKFDIWVEASCPVYLALFQNYYDDRPQTKAVYPNEKYLATYKPIPSGKAVKLPVKFAMDDDMRTEIMSIVIARSDYNAVAVDTINVTPAQSINNTVIGNNNNLVNTIVNASNSTVDVDTNVSQNQGNNATIIKGLTKFNLCTQMARKSSVKFEICSGNKITDPEGRVTEHEGEACLILFGTSKLAQYQLTMHK